MQYRLACPKLEPLGIRAGDWCSFPRWEGTIMMHRTFGLAVCAGALLALLSAVSGDAQAQSAVITGKVTGREAKLSGALPSSSRGSASPPGPPNPALTPSPSRQIKPRDRP